MRRIGFGLMFLSFVLSGHSSGAAELPGYSFKKAGDSTFYMVDSAADLNGSTSAPAWVRLRSPRWGTNEFRSTSRIVLEVTAPGSVSGLLMGRPLTLDKTVGAGLFILQAPDALTALEQAAQLSTNSEVTACYPVMHRPKRLASVGNYAPAPNDPFFPQQFQLENRAANGAPVSNGADINARGAWSVTRGEGIALAIVDAGVQYTHPDLTGNNSRGLNLDFSTVVNGNYATGSTNALPRTSADAHATEVAGLSSAVGNNGVGLSGVAPGAVFASWKIFSGGSFSIDSEQEMAMYQYQSNVVFVQNHSWTDAAELEQPLDALENAGIQSAVTRGRGGKGTILVRAAGNERANGGFALPDGNDANDDPYASDIREIAVAAVGADGRAASYSSPGACILAAVPGGDLILNGWGWPWQTNPPTLATTAFTTNAYADPNDPGYYASGPAQVGLNARGGFVGTSAATPVMSGIVSLILSANTNLSYRDVQQIIAVSSRHYDLADPAVQTNGGGLRVSCNVGYGVPDAGLAVRLAKMWTNRPPAISVTNKLASPHYAIPQDGLRLVISNAPPALQSIHGSPSYGAQADRATQFSPIVDVGDVTGPIQQNLAGKAVLIHPDTPAFPNSPYPPYQQVMNVAQAGAAFVITYRDHDDPTELRPQFVLSKTDFIPVPAMSITHADGTNLAAYLQAQSGLHVVLGQMITLSTNILINITNTLSCEHVRLTVGTDCTNRSGMRIVLTSPIGTQSVMQHLNKDTSPGPVNWTFSSTGHFFESSAGAWQVAFSYEQPGGSGNVTSVALAIDGVPIVDTDHDGLDDRWETQWFGNLAQGAKDSPAGDGWPNSVKQILGVNPKNPLFPFNVDLSLWNGQWARLAWPGVASGSYQILTFGGGAPTGVPGNFPEIESFIPYSAPVGLYFIKHQ